MKALHIHAWPKHYGVHCIPQSLHIHGKDIGINSIIYIISSKNIAMVRDTSNFNAKSSWWGWSLSNKLYDEIP